MGLSLSLSRDQNHIGIDFPNAYWHLESIQFASGLVAGELVCYPTRDVSTRYGTTLSGMDVLPFGGPSYNHVYAALWSWHFSFPVADAFPNGIPLDEDAQKTAIYNWIKRNAGVTFRDVFE